MQETAILLFDPQVSMLASCVSQSENVIVSRQLLCLTCFWWISCLQPVVL